MNPTGKPRRQLHARGTYQVFERGDEVCRCPSCIKARPERARIKSRLSADLSNQLSHFDLREVTT